jgi:hypothetical protein
MSNKEYLGDGVYVEHDGYQLILSVSNGVSEHFIYLEPEVWEELVEYVERLEGK